MAQSEFDWARDADSWDTLTLQQFERLRAVGSSDAGTDTPRGWKQPAEGRVALPRSKPEPGGSKSEPGDSKSEPRA